MAIYRKNYRTVLVTKWSCGSEYVHIRLDGLAEGDPRRLRRRDSSVVEVTIERMVKIGRFSKWLTPSIGDGKHNLSDETNCHDFAAMIDAVTGTDASRIDELRGYLDDLCDNEDTARNLDDDEVAFLGWICAGIWSEQASEVDNPFDEVQTIRYPIRDVLEQYCPSTQSGEWPREDLRPRRTR